MSSNPVNGHKLPAPTSKSTKATTTGPQKPRTSESSKLESLLERALKVIGEQEKHIKLQNAAFDDMVDDYNNLQNKVDGILNSLTKKINESNESIKKLEAASTEYKTQKDAAEKSIALLKLKYDAQLEYTRWMSQKDEEEKLIREYMKQQRNNKTAAVDFAERSLDAAYNAHYDRFKELFKDAPKPQFGGDSVIKDIPDELKKVAMENQSNILDFDSGKVKKNENSSEAQKNNKEVKSNDTAE